jgi:nucleotide-binding universal stress UspA family protein
MFTRVLVPLDGTTDSATALPPARTIARATGAEMTLLRIVPPEAYDADRAAAKEARQYLRQIADELVKGGTYAATETRLGANPAKEIVREVTAGAADLVVMTTHGRGGLARVALGSVAEGVLAHSPVPVMLLRPGGRRMEYVKAIVVPVDGTPAASLALSVAAPLAQTTGAKLVLLQVVLPSAYYYLEGLTPIDLRTDETMLAAAQSYVSGLVQRLDLAGIAAEGRAVLGRVSEQIVETADTMEANLIIMSTHALTGPMRTLLGSVADEVVRAAHQPVLLVRQGHSSMAEPTTRQAHQVAVV